MNTIDSMSEIAVKRVLTPWLYIKAIFNMSKYGVRHKQCLKILHGFTNRVIAERKAAMRGQVSASGAVSSDEDTSIGKLKASSSSSWSSSTIRLRTLGLFLPPENHISISFVVFLYFFPLQVCNLIFFFWVVCCHPFFGYLFCLALICR